MQLHTQSSKTSYFHFVIISPTQQKPKAASTMVSIVKSADFHTFVLVFQ